jgi:hypothetical protein
MSCQHRHTCNVRTSIPIFPIISDSDFQIAAHPSLALRGQDQEVCHRQSPLFQSIHGSSDDGTRRRGWDCLYCAAVYSIPTVLLQSQPLDFVFDTRGYYRLSCEHLTHLSPTLNSFNLQLTAEASTLSFICVIIIFIWIGVRPTSIHVFILFDEMLHSGTYIGIRRRSQTVTGSCFKGLPTSTWSA